MLIGTASPCAVLVDDDPDISRIVGRALERTGWVALRFGHAQEALDYLRSTTADIQFILSDIHMPGMSGLEFYSHLEETRRDLIHHFVFCSAALGDADVATFLECHPVPTLAKPLRLPDLHSVAGLRRSPRLTS
jgi:CheY-like chemotaxis protein